MSTYKAKKQHAPVDTSVELPAAIRAAAARSEQLHKAAYVEPAKEPEKDTAAPADNTPPSEEANEGNKTPEEAKAPAKAPEAEAQPARDQVAAPSQKGSSDDWEHKYNSLKGRHDQQAGTISTLTQRISEMEALIAQMNSAPEPAAPPAELTFKPIGQEERETYGEDFLDVAKRAAMEGLSPEVVRLNQQIQNLQAQVRDITHTTSRQQKQTIYSFLDDKMPNWREVNRSQDFIAWASLPDPFSGVTRIEMLREAYNKGDGPRVLNFFQGFLKDEAATDPVKSKPDLPANGQNKVPLEAFAAPGRAKAPASTPPVAPGEKETITRAQIANFYRLKAHGHWRGNPEEAAALEARIFEAKRDGRIV